MNNLIDEKHLDLWNEVKRTDPLHTKPITAGNLKGKTSITALGPVHEATRVYGPCGKGWGYEILEDRMQEGGPIFASKDNVTDVIARETTHTLLVKVWAIWQGDRLEATHYGHTPYILRTNYGCTTDHDYGKKSLSDAIKKCLTMFGHNADIFLGEFEDGAYLDELTQDMAIKRADDKDAETAKQKADYESWKVENTRAMDTSVQISELEALYVGGVRKANRWHDVDYMKAMNEAWKTRAVNLIESSPDKEKLQLVYKAATERAKGWNDKDWFAKVKKSVVTRIEQLDQEAAA